jgi:ABC-type glycerol-3-phosphate transport system substrate-binding protein
VDKGEPEEVTLRIFARAYTWNQDAPWEVAKKELQRRYPDIKFSYVEEGFGWSDLRAKFLTAAAGLVAYPPGRARNYDTGQLS